MSFREFLNEIRKEDLKNLDLNRDLLFSNIFGDKLRVVIPLSTGNQELSELIRRLKDDNLDVDLDDLINKKIVYKKIETKQGVKKRPEKVGGYLQKRFEKAAYPEIKKLFSELLDWWQKNSDKLKNNETGASIVISRSPIDLVRMSDHDNISSCHSPGGSFFKCAKQEARTGGAVAYVVKNSDIKNVDIQKPELFKDKQRGVDGIVPLERLRLRRFTDGSVDLLIPELRTYGTKNIGFYSQVKNWAQGQQKDIIDTLDIEKDYDSFDLKGGSYQDNYAGHIWGDFFDKEIKGEKQSLDEPDEEGDGEDLYDAAYNQIREHSPDWRHFSIHHDIYDENTLDYSAYCSFYIPVKLFNVVLSPSAWNLSKEDPNKKPMYDNWIKVKRIIEDAIDIYTISDMNLDVEKDKYVFNINLYDESSLMRNDNQLVRLEHFLDYIDDIDKNFEDHLSKVYKALADKGYIKKAADKISFNNFEIEEDDEGSIIKSKPEKIGYLKDFPVLKEGTGGFSQDRSLYKSDGKIFLNKFRNKFVTTKDFERLKIFPSISKSSEVKLYLNESLTSIKETDEIISIGTNKYEVLRITGWVYFEIEKNLGHFLTSNTKTIQLLKNIDNNWDFYINRMGKFFDSLVKTETRGYGWTRIEAPDFPFNNEKDFSPTKPIIKKPEYSQKSLNFKEHIFSEMPIKGFNLIGQWGPEAKRRYGYNNQDTGILENPKAVNKIHKHWSNTKYDFDFYFLRSYKGSKYREEGQVTQDWVKENLGIEINPKEDHITVIFTNNMGAEKIAMTAWTLAHRLGHAIRKEKIFEEYFVKQLNKDFNEILKYVYGLDPLDKNNYPFAPYYYENKYKKSLFLAVGKMKSARENNLRNSNEFIFELVAQYIITGKIKFNDLPRSLILDRKVAWGRPNYKLKNIVDEDVYQEYNAQLHNNAQVYEHYLDNVFGALVNKIFVM